MLLLSLQLSHGRAKLPNHTLNEQIHSSVHALRLQLFALRVDDTSGSIHSERIRALALRDDGASSSFFLGAAVISVSSISSGIFCSWQLSARTRTALTTVNATTTARPQLG
jgi:hypothetical protein